MNNIVNFDDLGLSPIILEIGGFALRWYSLAYLLGLVFGWWMLKRMLTRSNPPMSSQDVDDFLLWATIGVILGGRLGYVLFYNPAEFLADPLKIFAIWTGGMSFHGGVLGMLLAIMIFAYRRQLNWLRIGDYIVCVYPFGHMLGRLANFVNGELWGRPTDGSWGMIFPLAGDEPRHPSQLYQAGLEGLLPLIVLMFLFWRTDARHQPGLLVGVFFIIMGVSRVVLELFREPDRNLGTLSTGLTMGQTLTIPLLLVGLWLIIRRHPQTLLRESE
ncbi:MAG: prolipoprotein diacylglyceryl transferase [Pseudomonadota bacterium]